MRRVLTRPPGGWGRRHSRFEAFKDRAWRLIVWACLGGSIWVYHRLYLELTSLF